MKKVIYVLVTTVLLLSQSSCSFDTRISIANKIIQKKAPFDAIIVPGYPYVVPNHPYGKERDKVLLNCRLYFAKELYDKGITKNIIFSGAATHTPFVEGKVMKVMADSLGIPPNHTFVEDRAHHSNENAIFGRRLAQKLGFKNIVVATDPYQFHYMTLLLHIFTPGLHIIAFHPAQITKYIQPLPKIDTTAVFVKNFVPIDAE